MKEAEEVVGALQGSPFSDEQGAPGAGEGALLPVELSVEILEGLLQVGALPFQVIPQQSTVGFV